MAKFKLGDVVKIAGRQPLAKVSYSGHVLGLIEEPSGVTYTIQVKETGWIDNFLESELELIERSSAAKA